MKTTHSDYADDLATEIEHGPHWSQRRAATVRPELAAAPLPPRLPRAYQVSAVPTAGRAVQVAPAVRIAAVSHAPVRVPFYSHAEQQVAQQPAFYSYAEAQNAQQLDTERVAPLPMSSLRPDWMELLDRAWTRFAVPAVGMIAGLIFVVGYLAYSSQGGAAVAGAAASSAEAAPIVMSTEVAAAEQAPVADAPVVAPPAPREPTVTKVNAKPPVKRASSKRRAVRINDSTPLGDLRPSR
jgi:hypothetical protein